MVQRGRELDLAVLEGVSTLGVTAGASAPEVLVEEVLDRLRESYELAIEEVVVAEERITFKLPAALNA
jgi:4-hydroxy-3-methylbut-2-enyl diphosphate reductase